MVCNLCIIRSIEVKNGRICLTRPPELCEHLNAIKKQLISTPSILDAYNRMWPEIMPLSSSVVRPIPKSPPLSDS